MPVPTHILPITALVRRELISSLRQSRYFYLVLVAAIAAGLTVVALWPPDHPMPWQMKNASQGMFVFLGLTLALGAALSVPALAGSSIVSEREEETFELLAMTSAKPWHVLTAKLANSAGHYLLLLCALAPFAACAFFLVGLNTDILWRTLLVVSTTALVCASAGVLCSAKLRNPMAAVGLSYLATLFILGLPTLLILIVLELFGLRVADDFLNHIGVYAVPAVAFVVALGEGPGRVAATHSTVICSMLNVVLAVVLLLIAHALVYRNWGMSKDAQTESPARRRWRKPKARPPAHAFIGNVNPVYLRERWYEYPLRGWMRLLQFGVPFGLAALATSLIVLLHLSDLYSHDDEALLAFIGWHILEAMLLPALVAALTANQFTKEHERGNMDALRMTLLRPIALFTGKLMASLRVTLTVLVSACLGSLPLIVLPVLSPFNRWQVGPGSTIVCAFLMIVECLALAWAITAFCSLMVRRMAPALVASLTLATVVLAGIAIAIIIMGEGLRLFGVGNWVGAYSPYFAFGLYLDSPKNKEAVFGWRASHMVAAGFVVVFLLSSARVFAVRHMRDR